MRLYASAVGDLSIDDFELRPACQSWIGVILVLPEQVKLRADFDVIRDESFSQLFDDLRKTHGGIGSESGSRVRKSRKGSARKASLVRVLCCIERPTSWRARCPENDRETSSVEPLPLVTALIRLPPTMSRD